MCLAQSELIVALYVHKRCILFKRYRLALIFVCLFVLLLYVNSYGHCGTVSSPNHTFFLGKLEQAVNQ